MGFIDILNKVRSIAYGTSIPNTATKTVCTPKKVLDISEPVLSMVEVLETAPLNRFITTSKYDIGLWNSKTYIKIVDRYNKCCFECVWDGYDPPYKGLELFTKDEIKLLEYKLKIYFGRKLQRKQEIEKKRFIRKRDELVKLYCKGEVK